MVKTIRRYLETKCALHPGDAVVVGVSGGADSVCLLCVLREVCGESGVAVHGVHVNHNIRKEAIEDQRYVEALCEKLGIAFHCFSYPVEKYAKDEKISTEEAGRRLRYRAFYEVREKLLREHPQVKIAVAHTMDDNAETMLLNLFRGTGLKGLCGIPASQGEIIRPLLGVRRKEIEAWLREKGIAWQDDITNEGDDYTRNRIRHHILPVAEKEINDRSVFHMSRTADQLALAEDYLESRIDAAWENSVREEEDGLLIMEEAQNIHPYIRQRILMRAMEEIAGSARDISAVHVEALENLFDLQCGKKADLAYDMRAARTYEGIFLGKKKEILPEEKGRIGLNIPGETVLPDGSRIMASVFAASEILRQQEEKNGKFYEFPKDRYTKWFDYDKIKGTVFVRTREEGDYLSINAAGETQRLKAYLINEKISREKRDGLFLVAEGKHIMWVTGYRTSCAYYVTEMTRNILELKYLKKEIHCVKMDRI